MRIANDESEERNDEPIGPRWICAAHGCPGVGIRVENELLCAAHVMEPVENWQSITRVMKQFEDVLTACRSVNRMGIGDPHAKRLSQSILKRVQSILSQEELDKIEKSHHSHAIIAYTAELAIRRFAKSKAAPGEVQKRVNQVVQKAKQPLEPGRAAAQWWQDL